MKTNTYPPFQLAAIVICSAIAATGTFPYGYNFAKHFATFTPPAAVMLIGIFLGTTATLGNMGLGIYSLLRLKTKPPRFLNRYFLIIFSILSAVPTAFLFYFAYQHLIPKLICIIGSIIVLIINIGINYVAILNLAKEVTDNDLMRLPFGEKIIRLIGLVIGVLVSLTFYLATVNGITNLLSSSDISKENAYYVACGIALITWLPVAALFSYATQSVGSELHQLTTNFRKKIKKINLTYVVIIIIALGAGSSYAEMAVAFFGLKQNIPTLFQTVFSPTYMAILAYISAFSVNYLAIKNVIFVRDHE